jgi:GTPase SAR1 family protein
MKYLTYIVGEPGVGKTTLVDRLTAGSEPETTADPFYLRRHDNGVTELGKAREDFGGTDSLPMSIQPAVQQYLEAVGPALVLGEGDRLGNETFFAAAKRLGYTVTVYSLEGSRLAAMRRALRGSDQDATWLKGRATKVRNLAPYVTATIDAALPLDVQVAMMDDPVALAFRA